MDAVHLEPVVADPRVRGGEQDAQSDGDDQEESLHVQMHARKLTFVCVKKGAATSGLSITYAAMSYSSYLGNKILLSFSEGTVYLTSSSNKI